MGETGDNTEYTLLGYNQVINAKKIHFLLIIVEVILSESSKHLSVYCLLKKDICCSMISVIHKYQ